MLPRLVASLSWFGVSCALAARLLMAAPAFTWLRPAPNEQPQVVRMKLSLDATGAITAASERK